MIRHMLKGQKNMAKKMTKFANTLAIVNKVCYNVPA